MPPRNARPGEGWSPKADPNASRPARNQTKAAQEKPPAVPLQWGQDLPDQSKYPEYTNPAVPAQETKPKTVIQNGITYTLNETTGEYE